MKLNFIAEPEAIVVWGTYPPDSEWDDQIAWRNQVAQAICSHESNGFQYGVDISAGNVECGYLYMVGDKPVVALINPETGERPSEAQPATYCFYASWR